MGYGTAPCPSPSPPVLCLNIFSTFKEINAGCVNITYAFKEINAGCALPGHPSSLGGGGTRGRGPLLPRCWASSVTSGGGPGPVLGGHPGYVYQGEPGQSQAARALPCRSMNNSQNAAPGAQRTQPGDTCGAAGGASTVGFISLLLESALPQAKCFQAELIFCGLSHACYRKGCHRTMAVAELSLTGVTQPSILLHCAVFSRDGSWLRA